MARLRYVKSPEQVARAAEQNPEFLESTVSSLRAVYETDPALVAAVLPKPLEPTERPEVQVTFSKVAMHISPELTVEIGSGVFGVRARYEDTEGTYILTMPMTAEQAVLSGRDTYGEPKKIGEIDLRVEGDRVEARVTRMGITYLEGRGRLGEDRGGREYTEYAWCYKALPSCEKGRDFDGDPLLVRLVWQQRHREVRPVEGELVLRESPFDPVADLPVRRLVGMEYDVGTTLSHGEVIRSIPGSWLLPFLHQRYDDPTHPGVEIAV